MSGVKLPTYRELLYPTLQAIRDLGGSGTRDEIIEKAGEIAGISDEQYSILTNNGRESKVDYTIKWAISGLKLFGFIVKSSNVYTLTSEGKRVNKEEVFQANIEYNREYNAKRKKQDISEKAQEALPESDEEFWKDKILNVLQKMPPYSFEKFCKELLRKNGFSKVSITKQSGDEGIDGVGIYQFGLLSFTVLFQCKRYKNTVGSQDVRDFRGAMVGRTDKGFIMTTGTFTKNAHVEANRDGAPAIELMDGNALCDLVLKQQIAGIKIEMKPEVSIDEKVFLEQFEK